MRSSWFFRQGQRSRGVQALWVIFGLIVVMFYFTRRMLVSLRIGGWADDVDMPVNQWVLEHQSPGLQAVARVLYWWGSTPGMTVTMIVLTALLCWWVHSFWPLATVAFTATGSVLMTIVLKSVLEVERPDGIPGDLPPPESFSFPSGHSLNAAALLGVATYLAIVYGLRRYAWLISTVVALFVLAMGASRIYIAHHWLSDVLVGLLIGLGWGAVVAILHYFFVPLRPGVKPTR